MPEASLARKMKRNPDARAAIIHAPAGYETSAFPGLPAAASALSGQFDWVQLFVKNKAELEKQAPKVVKVLRPESILWISFPKGSSKVQTDLTRDQGWEAVRSLDLKWINLISVDETWSAFGFRLYEPGEARQPWR